jgi:lipid II:glycine glycyltransferase (peptidoglycan interpeptide bridge formation enzyme)
LETTSIEIATQNLKSNKRRNLKLSKKEGVVWKITKEIEEVNELYKILMELYNQKVKTPLFPLTFFHELLKVENAKIVVVKYNQHVIGGSVFVILPNKTIYEWFVCGEDRKYKNVYPSIVATWAGIEIASELGLKKFDFMGAGKPDVNYGVRDFKAEFGGTLVEHGRFLYICKPRLYALGKYIVKKMKTSK